MKKLVAFTITAGMFAFTACGPSAEEKAAQDKAKQDSIHMADSMAMAAQFAADKAKADSIAATEMAAKEKAKADSTRVADSLAALKKNTRKPVSKPKATPAPDAPKKVGSARGGK